MLANPLAILLKQYSNKGIYYELAKLDRNKLVELTMELLKYTQQLEEKEKING